MSEKNTESCSFVKKTLTETDGAKWTELESILTLLWWTLQAEGLLAAMTSNFLSAEHNLERMTILKKNYSMYIYDCVLSTLYIAS